MTTHDYNLLADPLLSVRHGSERLRLTLPDYLARLGAGDEIEPLALRAHQFHAWHAFLVQLGALVAHRAGNRSVTLSGDAWRQALLDLAGDTGDAAWSLVVSDLGLPAFLQSPVPERSLERFHNLVVEPDGLDVVITAKNHDVKADRIAAPEPEHWVYALLTLQTMEGFLGAGNYGIARMNGGFASRPAVASTPGLRWAPRFHRDVGVWLDTRDRLIESFAYQDSGGHALLWLLPWDGTTSRSIQQCDPFFLEICRRVRLSRRDGRIVAVSRPTEAAFLDAKQLHGDTGDIWTPVQSEAQGSKALTVSSGGFSYQLLAKLLFPTDFPRRPALLVRGEDGSDPLVVAQVLVRGSGKTEGYFQRLIPVPAKARHYLSFPIADGGAELGAIARARIEQAKNAQRFVLHPALCALLQGGADSLNLRDQGTRPWLDRMDAAVDQVFFPDLWAAIDRPQEQHQDDWNRRLRDLAWDQLEEAMAAAPVTIARRPRALAKAELRFRSAARKHLPFQSSPKETTPMTVTT